MHVRQMRTPCLRQQLLCMHFARNKYKTLIDSCNIIVYVCMPVFAIKCCVRQMHVRQMRVCK